MCISGKTRFDKNISLRTEITYCCVNLKLKISASTGDTMKNEYSTVSQIGSIIFTLLNLWWHAWYHAFFFSFLKTTCVTSDSKNILNCIVMKIMMPTIFSWYKATFLLLHYSHGDLTVFFVVQMFHIHFNYSLSISRNIYVGFRD